MPIVKYQRRVRPYAYMASADVEIQQPNVPDALYAHDAAAPGSIRVRALVTSTKPKALYAMFFPGEVGDVPAVIPTDATPLPLLTGSTDTYEGTVPTQPTAKQQTRQTLVVW